MSLLHCPERTSGQLWTANAVVQSELGAILNAPPIKMGDATAFDEFALS